MMLQNRLAVKGDTGTSLEVSVYKSRGRKKLINLELYDRHIFKVFLLVRFYLPLVHFLQNMRKSLGIGPGPKHWKSTGTEHTESAAWHLSL